LFIDPHTNFKVISGKGSKLVGEYLKSLKFGISRYQRRFIINVRYTYVKVIVKQINI